MAIIFKRLGFGRPANTSNLQICSVVGAVTAYLKSLAICNTTGSDATCRVFIVPPGGYVADQETAILYDFTIPANQSVFLSGIDHVLESGTALVVRSGTAYALTFTASGQEIS